MERCKVAIVIPAYNEEQTISKVITLCKNYGTPIVIDDGSGDLTRNLSIHSGAIVLSNKINCGYDASLNRGFKKALELGAEIIITIDGDGQHNPFLIPKFIQIICNGADVVVGNRRSFARFSEKIFSFYTRYKFGINDPLCGMKAYRTNVYEMVGWFDSYGSSGTELLLRAANKKMKIKQVEIDATDRVGGSRFGGFVGGNYKIIRSLIKGVDI